MEKKHMFLQKHFWVFILIHIFMHTEASNNTMAKEQTVVDSEGDYAWSSWGTWSPCSRSCGGGVAIQERECLPRKRSSISNVTASLEPAVRVTRQTSEECVGVARRYHECNTTPCTGGIKDLRAEQCASYDRRPFRGRFYTWVPYIDGDSPCTLNCRPLGQQFYASLALVADGTPCTRPGFRAICVQGACKVVGRDTVLASTVSRDVHCGRRLVSGLFSRPRLPLGYSYVTTVPRGACRLNVSEIVSSENYIALKISNGSYIMNGEFAISAPGTYEAVGTRFMYTRAAGLDSVFAPGPLHQPVDIMVLYTQPNPSITYEYFTESSTGDKDIDITKASLPEVKPNIPKHTRRHHSFDSYRPGVGVPRFQDNESKETSVEEGIENVIGSRRFTWKILSYTQCTRTCGGGIQLGKFRCVETTAGIDREISPIHCTGSAPAGRRRRCGTAPCPPRWRAAAWSTCPECGPAMRTRIVGCVQDHARGITKVSDQKCAALRPATTESCNVPDCEPTKPEKRVIRPREHTDHFRDGPVYTVAANSSYIDIGPEYTFNAAAGWLYTEWTECVGWHVGGGIQTRGVRCADPSGCAPRQAPESSRSCTPKFDSEQHGEHWFTGDWSQCTSSCKGKQIRGVLCIGNNGRHMRDAACKEPKPLTERDCEGDCSSTWYFSDWGRCSGNCTLNVGVQRRSVVCSKNEGAAASDLECTGSKPGNHKECDLECPPKTLPPDITIEAQKSSVFETTTTTTTSTTTTTTMKPLEKQPKDCEDKLYNCALAVQARLCHYNYYVQNCCHSCRGR